MTTPPTSDTDTLGDADLRSKRGADIGRSNWEEGGGGPAFGMKLSLIPDRETGMLSLIFTIY